jgi:hypothetical protein
MQPEAQQRLDGSPAMAIFRANVGQKDNARALRKNGEFNPE